MNGHSLDAFFQAALMVGFGIASLRLAWTAYMPGRTLIRVFRGIGAVLTFLWAAFYGHAVWGTRDLASLADVARTLQYMNLLMFLTWGFLWTENRWIQEARTRIAELEEGLDNGD